MDSKKSNKTRYRKDRTRYRKERTRYRKNRIRYRKDRNNRGGGVAIIIRNNIDYEILNIFDKFNTLSSQAINGLFRLFGKHCLCENKNYVNSSSIQFNLN